MLITNRVNISLKNIVQSLDKKKVMPKSMVVFEFVMVL